MPPRARMHRQNRLSRQQVEKLVTDYNDGASIQQLARTYRVDPDTASRWLKVSGVQTRVLGIAPERVAEAQALRDSGWSYQRIGEHFGCSRTTVRTRASGSSVVTLSVSGQVLSTTQQGFGHL